MTCFLSLFLSLKHPFRQQCSSSTHLKENIHKSYALSLSRTNSLGFQIPWFVELCKFRTKSSQVSYSVKWSLISMNSTSVSTFYFLKISLLDAHCIWQWALLPRATFQLLLSYASFTLSHPKFHILFKWSLISMNSTSVSAFFSPQNFTPGDAHCFWQ